MYVLFNLASSTNARMQNQPYVKINYFDSCQMRLSVTIWQSSVYFNVASMPRGLNYRDNQMRLQTTFISQASRVNANTGLSISGGTR